MEQRRTLQKEARLGHLERNSPKEGAWRGQVTTGEGEPAESKVGKQLIISRLLKEALPNARSLTVGDRFLAMGAPPIKPLRSPPRKESQHLDSVPPRGQHYTTIVPGKQETLYHLPHRLSPPCGPGGGLVGGA